MACTTLLVGKNASLSGSTLIARNEDSGSGSYCAKKMTVMNPDAQPSVYKSVLSHCTIPLPDHPLRYTCMPNASGEEGIWGAAGINSANVAMTATETITSNARVLGADPLVRYIPAKEGVPETPGGIGEEDIVTLTLPYIHSAREGVERLGMLHEKYGTYEMNGIAFQDVDEIWWFETIGGHHWLARRVPDDAYVVMPNQFGIDVFDLEDALGAGKNHLCSRDLKEFIEKNHLDASMDGVFNARLAFGSASDADHVYNTPRAWYMERFFNPHTFSWDGCHADYTPESDSLPWSLRPEKKISVEDVKYILSSHYQGTPYNPYAKCGDLNLRGKYRPIGINRNNCVSLSEIRPDLPEESRAVEWVAFGSNVFNAFVPLYTNIEEVPAYFENTTTEVTTANFYWANRIIGALADAHYDHCRQHIERYQETVNAKAREIINHFDMLFLDDHQLRTAEANREIERMVREETQKVLDKVLKTASDHMRNAYARSDA